MKQTKSLLSKNIYFPINNLHFLQDTSEHQQDNHDADVAQSLAIDIKPYVENPAATAEFDTLSPNQPIAKLEQNTPERGSNDTVLTFDECSTGIFVYLTIQTLACKKIFCN